LVSRDEKAQCYDVTYIPDSQLHMGGQVPECRNNLSSYLWNKKPSFLDGSEGLFSTIQLLLAR
jgi:hypothetical protein